MLKMKKAAALSLAALMLAGTTVPQMGMVYAQESRSGGSWEQSGDYWYYLNEDGSYATGWKQIDGKWYYFCVEPARGRMFADTVTPDGYYVGSDGAMVTEEGWQSYNYDWYYVYSDGKAASDWEQIGGKWYYFSDADGYKMLRDRTSDDGYYVGSDGAMVTEEGWQKGAYDWYYVYSNGKAAVGWKNLGGNWYFFNERGEMAESSSIDGYYVGADGVMATEEGWQRNDWNWFYVQDDTKLATGWQVINGKEYCFSENTYLYTETSTPDGYYVDSDGVLVTEEGWQYNGFFYYVKDDTKLAEGWYTIDDAEYYFSEAEPYGYLYSCTEIDGKILGPDGKVTTDPGWTVTEIGSLAYTGVDGELLTGWNIIGDKEYFFDSNGNLVTNSVVEDGTYVSYFGTPVIENGWHRVNRDAWVYVCEDGKAAIGWKQIAGSWYYFQTERNRSYGYLYQNCTTPDGYFVLQGGKMVTEEGWQYNKYDWYYVLADGSAVTGWKQINGNWYYFKPNEPGGGTGSMLYDTVVDGYRLGYDGIML